MAFTMLLINILSAQNYQSIVGDPLKLRIYKLKNGLTVMLSVNKKEPRIQTFITTNAGSKNDPSTHTGLAHYLEHMCFKGTDKYGTKDWSKEKPLLDQIFSLYEKYGATTNPDERKLIYKLIDSVSNEASKYAIASEYDKMVGFIGAQGTNAFTSVEQTSYVNDIPSNQLETWLNIEAERWRNPVLRLFHTELEAVYEEKNIGMDNDDRKKYEAFGAAMYKNHPYGTQTTIGTIEHLKKPSLNEIVKFYKTYYVPNNMAVILVGDFDPDKAFKLIEAKFSYMQPKPIPVFSFKPEIPRTSPEVIEISGQTPANLMMGWRSSGAGTKDVDLLTLTDLLLAYKGAGFLDLNITKAQKAQSAGSSPNISKDYSVHVFTGTPKGGQKLEDLKDLILEQIDKVKKGEFDEKYLKATLKNLNVDKLKQYETHAGRAYEILDCFTMGTPWEGNVNLISRLSKFTKKDVVDFANRFYTNDYVILYKRQGADQNVQKVEKPAITAISVNREDVSPFTKSILETNSPALKPLFVDYKKDINFSKLKNGTSLLYLNNSDNKLFSLYYLFEMGRRNIKELPIALDYLKYLGTDKYTADQLAKEFFKLGCEFGISATEDQVYVSLNGLQENFSDALKLFENFLANAKPDQKALDQLIAQTLKNRLDAKKSKQAIGSALVSYAIYGPKNPTTDRLSEAQLKGLKAENMVALIKSICDFKHEVMYYGPSSLKDISKDLNANHKLVIAPKDYPVQIKYDRLDMNSNSVYLANYDKMVQAEINWIRKGRVFDPKNYTVQELFNQYFGGDMSSVVFQTIRESKALAYSTWSGYSNPSKKGEYCYVRAYVGTQADKLPEAIIGMNELLNILPKSEQGIEQAKMGIKNSIETNRTTKTDIFFSYLADRKLGLDYDLKKDVYNNIDKLNFEDVANFHKEEFASKTYSMCVVGDKTKLNLDALKKQGNLKEVSLEELFGY